MIHELFTPIQDPQFGRVCSEIFTGEFRYTPMGEEPERYGVGIERLTDPNIQLLTVQASYMEADQNANLQNVLNFAAFTAKLPSLDHMMELYANSVGAMQEFGTQREIYGILARVKEFANGWPAIGEWYGNEVAKSGRSLLSAYFLGRIAGDNNLLVETLVYPEPVRQAIQFLIRDGLISTLPESGPQRTQMQDALLNNNHFYTRMADICASNRLLNTEGFKDMVAPILRDFMNE